MSAALRTVYPENAAERGRWIVSRRGERNALDPSRPYTFFVEEEHAANGEIVPVATIFLTNRECPWRCLMCDLWRNTLTTTPPPGAIAGQIEYALAHLPQARQIKLYNSGSFFDPRAIPVQDYPQISRLVNGFERVIVESHPALVGENCLRFHEQLSGRLEVAMGLETAHPGVLERLNKQMTLKQFSAAAKRLRDHEIDLRVFILVKPPFMAEEESLEWAKRSLDLAFDCGATAATLIPTRGGNGALDELALAGDFAPPRLATLEAAAEYGLNRKRGRVFADLWETQQLKACPACREERIARLGWMNLHQVVLEAHACEECGGETELRF